MDYSIINSGKCKTTRWSGGLTTELCIFPPAASYAQRNFKFRISTATVEVEESVFTSLNGFSRKLMILEGNITISHEGHYTKQLSRFDIDEFEGDWKTTSKGKCTDFNLMTDDKTTGNLSELTIEKTQTIDLKIENEWAWIMIYMITGKVEIKINNEDQNLNQNELLVLTTSESGNMPIVGIEKSEIILLQIV